MIAGGLPPGTSLVEEEAGAAIPAGLRLREARDVSDERDGRGERRDAAVAGPAAGAPSGGYAWLKRRLLVLVLSCAVLPLLLLGWGLHLHYTRTARERLMTSLEAQLDRHRKVIELFLADRKARLQLLVATSRRDDLCAPGRLAEVLAALNQGGWSYTDLGVIDGAGRHLAYAGPYDLLDRNYAETHWFGEVMRDGVHVSDMFLGFRNEPHFVIAVSREEDGRTWILRATIDTDHFRSLVEDVWVGRTGEIVLLDRAGRFQTRPRLGGAIMDASGMTLPPVEAGSRFAIVPAGLDAAGRRVPRCVVGHVWLQEPAWLLVIRQDYGEAFGDLVRAGRASLIFVHLAVLLFGGVGIVVTRQLLAMVRERDRRSADLGCQLLEAGKMAALGELAAGVAHEINNPLAIIGTERQLLLDDLDAGAAAGPGFPARLRDALGQVATQVERCRRITHALLNYARPVEAVAGDVDLNRFLCEVVALVEREARSSGIEFRLDLATDLPAVQADPAQLQQVFLNLVTNAIDAHDGKPYGTVILSTRRCRDGRAVEAVVADTGTGVAPEVAARVFDPFFTTKATGKGTGLGLAICLGTVRGLGGDIALESEAGIGTCVRVTLPVRSAVTRARGGGTPDDPAPRIRTEEVSR
jgi:two-component system NtrC family sensor kinase